MIRRRLPLPALVIALSAIVLSACGGSNDTSAGSNPSVADAWARQSPSMTEMGAAYMRITGGAEPDALVGVSVPADVAGEAQIHETVEIEMEGHSDMDLEGAMTMRGVERVELPAGETVAFEPGGYHVMLLGITQPLTAGGSFEMTLDFETGPDQTVTVEVRES
jgi:copper(I)-binding protein